MGAIFVIEVIYGRQYRIRGSLSQTAQGRVFDHAAEVFQCLKIFHGSLTLRDFIQGFVQAFVADTTRCTFTAGFFHCEFKIEFGNRYHTVVFVHHDHTTGTHHGTGCQKVIEINRYIQVFLGQATAGRTSGLYRFKFFTVFDTATNLVNHFTKGSSHGNLDQSHGTFRSDFVEPVGSLHDDRRDISQGFHVVHVGRAIQVT